MDEYYFYNGELVKNESISTGNIPPNAIYEVMRLIDGKPLFFEDHMERFENSVNRQGYVFNIPRGEVLNEIIFLCDANGYNENNVRIVYIPLEEDDSFDFVMYFSERIKLNQRERNSGVIVKTFEKQRKNPNIKTIGESFKDMKKEQNVFEYLFNNEDEIISEGSRSNVFFYKNGSIYTSPSDSVLLGITRKKVIQICENLHINVVFKEISLQEAYSMDCGFLTGTSIGVAPIARLNEKEYNNKHEVVQLLKQKYESLVNDYIKSFVLPE